MTRTILIDADHLAFTVCAALLEPVKMEEELGRGYYIQTANLEDTKDALVEKTEELLDLLNADKAVYCLTDPYNFRYDVFAQYKANRSEDKKPFTLKLIRDWLMEEKDAWMRRGLEGDDIMGILSTSNIIPGQKIIVSIDKDMKTIPGLYVRNVETDPFTGKRFAPVQEITEAEADRWHMIQTLAGDATDGYPGCPGVGLTRATEAVDSMTRLEPYEYQITRGKRKGEVEVRYEEAPADNLWDVVVSRYKAAGLNEEAALQQARVARICRANDYDFQRKRPILWTPPSR